MLPWVAKRCNSRLASIVKVKSKTDVPASMDDEDVVFIMSELFSDN